MEGSGLQAQISGESTHCLAAHSLSKSRFVERRRLSWSNVEVSSGTYGLLVNAVAKDLNYCHRVTEQFGFRGDHKSNEAPIL